MKLSEKAFALRSFLHETKTSQADQNRCYNRYSLSAEDRKARVELAAHIRLSAVKSVVLSGTLIGLTNFAFRRAYRMPKLLFFGLTAVCATAQWSHYEYAYFERAMVEEMARHVVKFDSLSS